eukprot:Hpha_TRINITY_DN15640_c10_g1::TRINITY_DN15640_c10_g1_i1::g.97884::m.97884
MHTPPTLQIEGAAYHHDNGQRMGRLSFPPPPGSTDPIGGPETAQAQRTRERIDRQALQHSSLWIFPAVSEEAVAGLEFSFRVVVYDFTHWRAFEAFVVLLIFGNCVFLALDDPTVQDPADKPDYLTIGEIFFTAAFGFELCLKVYAQGFVWHPGSYLRNGWNRLDFIIVLLSGLAFVPGVGNYSAIRTLRVLRPLRSINGIQGLKNIVNAILHSMHKLVNVLSLAMVIFAIFGILGVQLWSGMFQYQCVPEAPTYPCMSDFSKGLPRCCRSDPTVAGACCVDLAVGESCATLDVFNDCNCSVEVDMFCAQKATSGFGRGCDEGFICVNSGRDPLYGYGFVNFDHIGFAVLAIFQCLTMEGWTDIMYIVQDVWSDIGCMYFILLVVTGSYFVLNLALAVINEEFEQIREQDEERHMEEMRRIQMEEIEQLQMLFELEERANEQREWDEEGFGVVEEYDPDGEGDEDWEDGDDEDFESDEEEVHEGEEAAAETPDAAGLRGITSFRKRKAEATGRTNTDDIKKEESEEKKVDQKEDDKDKKEPVKKKKDKKDKDKKKKGKKKKKKKQEAGARGLPGRGPPGGAPGGSPSPAPMSSPPIRALTGEEQPEGEEGEEEELSKAALCWQTLRWKCYFIVVHKYFTPLIIFFIAFNTVCLALEHHGQPASLTAFLDIANLVLTWIFFVEMVLKLMASGILGYLEDSFNVLDGGIVIVSIIEFAIEMSATSEGPNSAGANVSVFRALRLLRVFKLLKNFPQLRALVEVIIAAVDDTGYLNVIILLYIFCAALVGMQFFGGRFVFEEDCPHGLDPCEEMKPRATFDDIYWSVLTVFQVLTRDDWVNVMWSAMRATHSAYCLFFLVLVVCGDFVILNLFLAILIQSFEVNMRDDDMSSDSEGSDSEKEQQENLLGDLVGRNSSIATEHRPHRISHPMHPSSEEDRERRGMRSRIPSTLEHLSSAVAPMSVTAHPPMHHPHGGRSSLSTPHHHGPLTNSPSAPHFSPPLVGQRTSVPTTSPIGGHRTSTASDAPGSRRESYFTTQRGKEGGRNSLVRTHWHVQGSVVHARTEMVRKSVNALGIEVPTGQTVSHTSSFVISPPRRGSNAHRSPQPNLASLSMRRMPSTQGPHGRSPRQDDLTFGVKPPPKFGSKAQVANLSPRTGYLSARGDDPLRDTEPMDDERVITRAQSSHSQLLAPSSGALQWVTTPLYKPSLLLPSPGNVPQLRSPSTPTHIPRVASVGTKSSLPERKGCLKGTHADWAAMSYEYDTALDRDYDGYNEDVNGHPLMHEGVCPRCGDRLLEPVWHKLQGDRGIPHRRILHEKLCPQIQLRKIRVAQLHRMMQIVAKKQRSHDDFTDDEVEDLLGMGWEVGLFLDRTPESFLDPPTRVVKIKAPNEGFVGLQVSGDPPTTEVTKGGEAYEAGVRSGMQVVTLNGSETNADQITYGLASLDRETGVKLGLRAVSQGAKWQEVFQCLESQLKVVELRVGEEIFGGGLVQFTMGRIPYKIRTNGGKSLFLFGPENSFRLMMYWLIQHKWFDRFILLCIVVASITMVVENPRGGESYELGLTLVICNYFFTSVFILELICKVIAMGFVLGKRHSRLDNKYASDPPYIRDPWNVLDFCIVLISMMSLLEFMGNLGFLKVLRAFRALRPLRVISRRPGLQRVVVTLLRSMSSIGPVTLVTILVFLVFGILGVQLFAGKTHQCTDLRVRYRSACLGWWYSDGQWQKREWKHWKKGFQSGLGNFDNIGYAMLTLFEVASLELWTTIMYIEIDAKSTNEAPERDTNRFVGIFFIVFVVVGSFFILNLFVGFVIFNFEQVKKEADTSLVTEGQQLWIETQRMMLNFTPSVKMEKRDGRLAKKAHAFALSTQLEFFIGVCIMLNVAVMGLEFKGMSADWELGLEITNGMFSGIFLLEAMVKLFAFGVSYFHDSWNRFDFSLVLLSVFQLLFLLLQSGLPIKGGILRVFRVFRIMRILRLVKSAKDVRILLETVWYSLPQIANIGAFMGLLGFIFAVLGVNLFAKVKRGEYLTYHANFETFPRALLMLTRIMTGENWNGVMHETMVQPPECDSAKDECGIMFAPGYYIVFLILATFILTNLFVAIILNNFRTTILIEKSDLRMKDLHEFIEIWPDFSKRSSSDSCFAARSLIMPTSLFPQLLKRLGPPLGIKQHGSRIDILRRTTQYCIPEHAGVIHFIETLIPLARQVMVSDAPMEYEDLRGHEEQWRLAFPDINTLPVLRFRQRRCTVDQYFSATYIAAAYRRSVAMRDFAGRIEAKRAARRLWVSRGLCPAGTSVSSLSKRSSAGRGRLSTSSVQRSDDYRVVDSIMLPGAAISAASSARSSPMVEHAADPVLILPVTTLPSTTRPAH